MWQELHIPPPGPKHFVQGHTTRKSECARCLRCLSLSLNLSLSLPALADPSLGTWGGAVTGHLSLGAFRGCLPPNLLPNIHLEGSICEHSPTWLPASSRNHSMRDLGPQACSIPPHRTAQLPPLGCSSAEAARDQPLRPCDLMSRPQMSTFGSFCSYIYTSSEAACCDWLLWRLELRSVLLGGRVLSLGESPLTPCSVMKR